MSYLDDLINKAKKKPAEEGAPAVEQKPAEPKRASEQETVTTPAPAPKPVAVQAAPPVAVKAMPVDEELSSARELVEEYGDVRIYRLPDRSLVYTVPVPKPTGPERQIIDTVKEAATRLITVTPEEIKDPVERREFFKKRVIEIIDSSPELGIPAAKIDFYADTIVREMIGYGALDMLLQDGNLEEIMVIGPHRPVYLFHRKYEMIPSNVVFGKDDAILAIIDRIARDVGRRIDVKDPLLDARLPDGSRVNATIPPISLDGSTITIRKFREDPFTVVDLIKFGTIDAELAAFLWLCVEGMSAKPANIIVSGGTGSGKTTTLNTLASFIPSSDRILTMEDTAELKIPVKHWVRFETRPPGIEGTGEVSMDTLVKNALRMRPDRIVVGEIRGPEAFTMFTAMNTGHDGSLGTIHANSARETLVRLTSPPMSVPDMMLAALNLIVVQKRIHDRRKGTIRRVTEVAELTGVLEGQPQTIYLYEWDAASDTMKSTGVPSRYMQELSKFTGASNVQIRDEVQRRKEFLEDLVKRDIRGIDQVCARIHEFVG